MTEQAQIGDTVRLTIEGEVYQSFDGWLMVDGTLLKGGSHRTYEILSHVIPLLPSKPGYYLSSSQTYNNGVLQLTKSLEWWWVGNRDRPCPKILTQDEVQTHSPLNRLTVNV